MPRSSTLIFCCCFFLHGYLNSTQGCIRFTVFHVQDVNILFCFKLFCSSAAGDGFNYVSIKQFDSQENSKIWLSSSSRVCVMWCDTKQLVKVCRHRGQIYSNRIEYKLKIGIEWLLTFSKRKFDYLFFFSFNYY